MIAIPKVGQVVYDLLDLPVKVTGYIRFDNSYQWDYCDASEANGISGVDAHECLVHYQLKEINERKVIGI